MKMWWDNLISRCSKKLLPSTLCSLKFASCEKHVKNEKDKLLYMHCMILEVASWQSFSLSFLSFKYNIYYFAALAHIRKQILAIFLTKTLVCSNIFLHYFFFLNTWFFPFLFFYFFVFIIFLKNYFYRFYF